MHTYVLQNMKTSAGVLMYRIKDTKPEVLLVHPGGPFWAKKDEGSWSIPKGEADNNETGDELLDVAKREFEEETWFKAEGNFKYLGEVKNKSRKVVKAWAVQGDLDPAQIKSNVIEIDWPPGSGKKMEIPEVDRGDFFELEEAKRKINPYQIPLIDEFEKTIANTS